MLEAEALKRGFELDDEGRMPSGLAWPRTLDLYAGSGALGIEALSRGAASATFIEKDGDAVKTLRTNLLMLRFDGAATVIQAQLPHGLDRLSGTFDLVLLDAPYADDTRLIATLERIGALKLLNQDGVVAVEQAAGAPWPQEVAGLPRRHPRQHGKTEIALYTAPPGAEEIGR